MEHKPLRQQVLVVFGATSGIGRATALAALDEGARVVAAGRDRGALDSLAMLSPIGRLTTCEADAADPDAVASVAERAVTEYGRLDTWAHVAGVGVYGRFEDITPAEFRRAVEVDLLGPVWGARAALPYLRRHGGAYVVVSSEVAKRSFPLMAPYAAAKHGVNGFVEALRLELRHEGAPVSVTQILPQAVSTPFFEHARSRLGVRASGPPPVTTPQRVAERILHAAEHGGRDIPVGVAARAQLALQRLSPRLMDAVAGAMAFRLQRSPEPRSPGDDILLDAPHGDDRVHGIVSNTRR